MSKEYHYLIAGLPDILFDDNKQAVSLGEFKASIGESVSGKDFELIASYFLTFDNQNVMRRLSGTDAEINAYANFSAEQLDELFQAVKEGDIENAHLEIPLYLGRFIEAYRNEQPLIEGASWENQLSQLYFEHVAQLKNPFVTRWYLFEQRLQNLQTAFQCRKHEMDIAQQLVGSDEVNAKLAKSGARDFGLSDEIPYLEDILKALEEEDVLEREKRIDLIRWKHLDEEVFFHYFTIERIFAYTVMLSIIDRWMNLDKETGLKLFNEFISSLESSYELPREFSLN